MDALWEKRNEKRVLCATEGGGVQNIVEGQLGSTVNFKTI